MRAWLAVAVVVCGGCTCSDGVCVPTMAMPQTLFIATAGAPVTVTVLNTSECGSRVPTSAVSSVLDPEITPTPSTISAPRVVSGQGFAADVTFTPSLAGEYHVVARFEPNFGKAEVDVIVAADRRDAGTVDSLCAHGDFTPGGLTLCYRNGGVDVVGTAQRLDGAPIVRRGPTLWANRGGRLERWVEDGGAFSLVESATVDFTRIVPGIDDALLIGTGSKVHWWVDGGAHPTGLTAPVGIWLGAGTLVTVTTATGPGAGWCVTALGGDGGARCSEIGNFEVIGTSPDGIAVELAAGAQAIVFDDRSAAAFRLPPGWHLDALGESDWDDVAVLRSSGPMAVDGGPYVLRTTPTGVILEDYGPSVLGATSTCVTTGTKLMRR